MIRYALICDSDHAFEGWFGSSADYDDQQGRGLLDCPVCGSKAVRKQIMAPAVTGTRKTARREDTVDVSREMMMEALGRVRRHVEEHFDDVGDAFAKEARAIHDGKAEDRGIYGRASAKEVRELVEDGIQVAPLPAPLPKKTELN